MSCASIRAGLPALVYGDLPPEEAARVERHVADCAACRKEYAALQQLRTLLDAGPAPEVRVDLVALYRQSAERRRRQAQRWRRLATALTALAAVVLLAVSLRMEVRVQAQQLVIHWGQERPDAPAPTPQVLVQTIIQPDPATQADVQLLKELVHALADDVEGRDERYRRAIAHLQDRVDLLQVQSQRRWTETDQNVAALYLLTKGDKR